MTPRAGFAVTPQGGQSLWPGKAGSTGFLVGDITRWRRWALAVQRLARGTSPSDQQSRIFGHRWVKTLHTNHP
jgi:hypothetical protein